MNRKLQHSLLVAASGCALLVIGLLASTPAVSEPADSTPAIAQVPQGRPHPHATTARSNVRYRGQSVRMPFFSFAPRG